MSDAEFLDSDRVANVYFTITSTSTNDVLPLYNRCNFLSMNPALIYRLSTLKLILD